MNGEPRGGDPAGSAAARLRQLRARHGLSQEQLARLLGVSFATVNRWRPGGPRCRREPVRRSPTSRPATARRRPARHPASSRPASTSPASTSPASTSPAGPAPRRRLRRTAPCCPSPSPASSAATVELAELTGLLDRARLLTLIGPGGAGKTRLAAEAISRSAPSLPVAFIPLETVRQPESLITALASGLRVPDRAGVPLPRSITAALAETPRLIVLDGAEHLRDAVAALAGDLLGAGPGVRVVVTSRVLLGAPGEVCWTVPPLECPSAAAGVADIAESDAVQLFVARARERLPELQRRRCAARTPSVSSAGGWTACRWPSS